jgi:hypothetical protein
MALEIITGAVTTHDATIGAVSVQCAFAQMGIQINAQGIPATTFCSSKFVEEKKGLIQADLSLVGYTTSGASYSDPLLYVLNESSLAFVGLAKTGCSLSFACNFFTDGMSLNAAFNSGRVLGGRSTGAITGAWVVA